MIAKGNLHAHGGRLAVYMTTGKDGERAELIEARGFLSDNLREGFCTIQAIADGLTQCQKPFFHAYVRLPDSEALERPKWLAAADRIEAALGFDGQPRAVAFHIAPDGQTHMHVAWSRIDTEVMRAIDPGLYKNKMVDLARELELEYGLTELSSDRAPGHKTQAPNRPEFEESRRLAVDVRAVRETIRQCFDRSDNGPSFLAALGEHKLTLARGDRRDFVVIDAEGGQHALGKRICGVTAEDIRARLGGGFKQSLPTVADARRQLAAQRSTVNAVKGEDMDEPSDALLENQPKRESTLLLDLAEQDKRVQEFKRQREAEAEEARKKENERRIADERRAAEGDIASAQDRYAQALGQNYDMRDPYTSLARAAMSEYGTFKRQQEDLRKEIARTKDPQDREALELRQRIEGCEYMAVTSQRLAGISATIAGREDAPTAILDRERAQAYQEQAKQLREERAKQQERISRQQEQSATRPADERQNAGKAADKTAPRSVEKSDRDSEITDAKAARLSRQDMSGASSKEPTRPQGRGSGRGER